MSAISGIGAAKQFTKSSNGHYDADYPPDECDVPIISGDSWFGCFNIRITEYKLNSKLALRDETFSETPNF